MSIWLVYVLRSEKSGRFYTGSTDDLDRRLLQHNSGHTPSTRGKGPWSVVYSEPADDEKAARRRELQIKAWKSRTMIEKLVGQYADQTGRASR